MARDGSADTITDGQTAPINNSGGVAVISQSTDNKVVHVKSANINLMITKACSILEG